MPQSASSSKDHRGEGVPTAEQAHSSEEGWVNSAAAALSGELPGKINGVRTSLVRIALQLLLLLFAGIVIFCFQKWREASIYSQLRVVASGLGTIAESRREADVLSQNLKAQEQNTAKLWKNLGQEMLTVQEVKQDFDHLREKNVDFQDHLTGVLKELSKGVRDLRKRALPGKGDSEEDFEKSRFPALWGMLRDLERRLGTVDPQRVNQLHQEVADLRGQLADAERDVGELRSRDSLSRRHRMSELESELSSMSGKAVSALDLPSRPYSLQHLAGDGHKHKEAEVESRIEGHSNPTNKQPAYPLSFEEESSEVDSQENQEMRFPKPSMAPSHRRAQRKEQPRSFLDAENGNSWARRDLGDKDIDENEFMQESKSVLSRAKADLSFLEKQPADAKIDGADGIDVFESSLLQGKAESLGAAHRTDTSPHHDEKIVPDAMDSTSHSKNGKAIPDDSR